MSTVTRSHFILYVIDQEASRAFYEMVLAQAPTLHVPGMTEFTIAESVVVGLMPETGIMRLLDLGALQMPASGQIRGELYLVVDHPDAYHARALLAGAKELSPMAQRSWGDFAAYSMEPNGYVLAFAQPSEQN